MATPDDQAQVTRKIRHGQESVKLADSVAPNTWCR